MPYTPLMDRVHSMTFAKKMLGVNLRPGTQASLRETRMQLRRAEKFVIDDDTVRLVCHLSHEHDMLEGWSFLARLPFEVCWFEFNLHAKVGEFHKMGRLANRNSFEPDKISPTCGYLLYRDDPGSDSPRWFVQQFYEFPIDGKLEVHPGLLSYVFDPEGSDFAPVRGSTKWRLPTLSLIPNFPKIPVSAEIGKDGIVIQTTCDPEILMSGDMKWRDGRVVGADWCQNRAAVTADPFWNGYYEPDKRGKLYDILATEVREETGHIRWLMTLLAAINGIPRDIKQAQTRTGTRQANARILPYFQHRTITLKVPDDNRIIWARKRLQSELRNAPRPLHPVKGHWRIIELGKAPAHICRHQPTMVENGVGMCEKCQLMIRWIKDYTRGTPEIGIVEHTYNVRKA